MAPPGRKYLTSSVILEKTLLLDRLRVIVGDICQKVLASALHYINNPVYVPTLRDLANMETFLVTKGIFVIT